MEGYIYVASNISMPGLVKIGCTGNEPAGRMKQLYTTGVPTPFIVEYSAKVSDYRSAERKVHNFLRKKRLNKEFFECTPAEAIAAIEAIGLVILKRKIKAQHISEAQSRTEKHLRTFREKESARLKEINQRKLDAQNAREEQQRKSRIAPWIAWPVGIITSVYMAQILPISINPLGFLFLVIVGGCLSGYIFSWMVTEWIVKNYPTGQSDSGETEPPTPHKRSVPVINSPPIVPKKDPPSKPNDNTGFQFKWWYLIIIIGAIKALSVIARNGL